MTLNTQFVSVMNKSLHFIILSMVILTCACSQKISQAEETADEATCLGGYSGKYYVTNGITGWDQPYNPDMSAWLSLFSDNTCMVGVGLMASPYIVDVDKFTLHYAATSEGLDIYDTNPSNPLFIVSASGINHEVDKKDVVNYLGSAPLIMSWTGSLGKAWDKYSSFGWPSKIELTLTPVD